MCSMVIVLYLGSYMLGVLCCSYVLSALGLLQCIVTGIDIANLSASPEVMVLACGLALPDIRIFPSQVVVTKQGNQFRVYCP
jgi:hypothetical protein